MALNITKNYVNLPKRNKLFCYNTIALKILQRKYDKIELVDNQLESRIPQYIISLPMICKLVIFYSAL